MRCACLKVWRMRPSSRSKPVINSCVRLSISQVPIKGFVQFSLIAKWKVSKRPFGTKPVQGRSKPLNFKRGFNLA